MDTNKVIKTFRFKWTERNIIYFFNAASLFILPSKRRKDTVILILSFWYSVQWYWVCLCCVHISLRFYLCVNETCYSHLIVTFSLCHCHIITHPLISRHAEVAICTYFGFYLSFLIFPRWWWSQFLYEKSLRMIMAILIIIDVYASK